MAFANIIHTFLKTLTELNSQKLNPCDDQLLIAQDYEDLEHMTRKLIEEYELWGLKMNVKKTKYMAIGDTLIDLHIEEGKGTINHVNEYTYLGVKITKDGKSEPEINDGINKGRAAITHLNGILWDREMTPKTKTHIYHATVKSTITYAAETWCLKAKTTAKLNSTEIGLLATFSSYFQERQN
jgi:polyribonucleotide nucleotidyltransferase